MSRLVDVDALGIGEANREVFVNPEYADGWNSAIDIIYNAPTVDAVEVVRCKDCRYWGLTNFVREPTGWCGRQEKTRNPDWFCADGKRKGE